LEDDMKFKIGIVLGSSIGYLVGSGRVRELVRSVGRSLASDPATLPTPEPVEPPGSPRVVVGPGIADAALLVVPLAS
jgi:hypothetical protein